MFDSREGYLHFLFANEDHYYLDSLLRMNLTHYLHYLLKGDGYCGVFFVQDLRGGCCVVMNDKESASVYSRKALRGVLNWYKDAPVEKERGTYRVEHRDENEMTERILRLIEEPDDNYAIVMPMQVFCRLFQRQEYLLRLITVLKEKRQNSILLITASLKANESMPLLLDRHGVFGSGICPEIERLQKRQQRFLLYEELEMELRHCYHAWDVMTKKKLRRMLLHGLLLEGWPLEPDCLEDFVDFIYAWYHSRSFAHRFSDVFKPYEWKSMKALEQQLSRGQCLERLEKALDSLRREYGTVHGLGSAIAQRYRLEEGNSQPRLQALPCVARMDKIKLEALFPEADRQQYIRTEELFFDVRKELLQPWSDGSVNLSSMEFCMEWLRVLSEYRTPDPDSVRRVIDLMEYSVHSREQDEGVFRKKTECYQMIVRLSAEIHEMRGEKADAEERLQQETESYRRLLLEVKEELSRKNGNSAAWEGGKASGELFLADAKKKEVLTAKKNADDRKLYIGTLAEGIERRREIIRNLEAVIRRLQTGSVMGEAAGILSEASALVRQQAVHQDKEQQLLEEVRGLFESLDNETDGKGRIKTYV